MLYRITVRKSVYGTQSFLCITKRLTAVTIKKGGGRLRAAFFTMKKENNITEADVRRWEAKAGPPRDHVRWLDRECTYCGRQLNSWDQRIANALMIGFDLCEHCVAEAEYGITVEKLRQTMLERFGMEPCKGV